MTYFGEILGSLRGDSCKKTKLSDVAQRVETMEVERVSLRRVSRGMRVVLFTAEKLRNVMFSALL